MAELRTRLRMATAPLHEQVDSAYAAFDFDQEGGYLSFLRAHGRVLGSIEVALEQAGITHLLEDWPERVRRHALFADLEALGSPVPLPLPAPELDDSAGCWGAAYVLEGSRLGGRVLARRLHQLDPSAPSLYLEHGDTAKLWPTFLAQLETAHPCTWPAIQAAAEATFELFIRAAALEHSQCIAENEKGPEGPFHHVAETGLSVTQQ